jgi:hypothetical protein
MNRTLILGLALTLIAQLSIAQAAQQQASGAPATTQPPAEMRVEPGITLRVELVKTIDAKKAKPGDPVVAKTVDELMSGSHVAAPRGTKIFGHVVAAAPHHGDTPSTLEIAFDKISISAENEVPMKAVIQALSKPVEIPAVGSYGSPGEPAGAAPMGAPAGGRMGGGSPPIGASPNSGPVNPNGMPGASSAASNPRIPLNAQGVIGMSGISLSADAQANSTITSEKHNVKLDGGTQMILRVTQ